MQALGGARVIHYRLTTKKEHGSCIIYVYPFHSALSQKLWQGLLMKKRVNAPELSTGCLPAYTMMQSRVSGKFFSPASFRILLKPDHVCRKGSRKLNEGECQCRSLKES
jgi:hypothetical protein